MTTPERYRLVIIGAGAAGLTAADLAARLRVPVALVERSHIGGDCTWTGCVPSKALLHAASVAHTVRTAARVGVHTPEPEVDFAAAMASVRDAIARVYQCETPEALARRGITVIAGEARFVDPYNIEVAGRRITGERFLIATGAAPAIPPIPGLQEVPYLTYETVFDLTSCPRGLFVLGAGPIGVEFAQAFRRLGVAVTLIEQEGRVAPLADPEASEVLQCVLVREGVTLRLGMTVQCVAADGDGIHIELSRSEGMSPLSLRERGAGRKRTSIPPLPLRERGSGGEGKIPHSALIADALLLATGRRPRLAALDLDRAGVTWSPQGVVVNDQLRTSQPHIFACGDAVGSHQFTHYAGWQAYVAVRNALLPGASRGRLETVPWAIFTDPEVAQVGLDEQQARARLGAAVRVTRWPVERIDRAVAEGETEGLLKLVHRPNGALLGATLVCKRAGELAQEVSLALARGIKLGDLAATIHVYPTYGSALQQAAADALLARFTTGMTGLALRLLAQRWPRL